MDRSGILESLIGIVVVAAAAAFMIYAFSVSGRTLSEDTYRLDAVFGKVDGITTGSDVRIAGVKIGSVSDFTLDTNSYEATVSMMIDKSVPVPDDSVAKIVSDGLLGGAHIALEPGASEFFLAEGDSIFITQGSVDLLGLAVQAFTSGAGDKEAGAGDPGGLSELPPIGDGFDPDSQETGGEPPANEGQ